MDWQDIATAPKDGTIVLLAFGDDVNVGYRGRGECRHWHAFCLTGEWDDQCENNIIQPTHWQPLPAPPVRPGDAQRDDPA